MSDTDNEKPISAGRRRLLGTLATGGAAAVLLPEKWTRPVIDRILVPAHAQQVSITSVLYYTNQTQHGQSQSDNLFERIADALIPSAHAVPGNGFVPCSQSKTIGVALYPDMTASLCVSGATGTGNWFPNRTIGEITATGCSQLFKLTNATITSDMLQVNGTLTPLGNTTCTGGLVTLNRDSNLPSECTDCPVIPPEV